MTGIEGKAALLTGIENADCIWFAASGLLAKSLDDVVVDNRNANLKYCLTSLLYVAL